MKKKGKTVYSKKVGIKTVSVGANGQSVTINLAKPYKGVVQVTVLSGLMAANGTSSPGNVAQIVH